MARITSPRLKMAERLAMALAPKVRRAVGEIARQQVKAADFREEAKIFQTELGRALVEKLVESYPEDGLVLNGQSLKEAQRTENDVQYTWHVQSLGALENFSRSQAGFYHLFTLFKNGEPTEALAYNPITDDVTLTQKGQGAFSADQRLRVSGRKDLSMATAHFCEQTLSKAVELQQKGTVPRLTGAFLADVVAVAAGHADVFYKAAPTLAEAGFAMLMLTESGGRTSSAFTANKLDAIFIGANSHIFKILKAS